MDFASLSAGWNVAVFASAAAVVWIAGARMARYADEIAERTGLGRAFVGFFVLAIATSLPEVATTVTAAAAGNARLLVNNLLGGVVSQTAILAVADAFVVGGALTFFSPRPVLLLQGIALVGLIALTVAGMAAGPVVTVHGVGLWTALLLVAWIAVAYALKRYEEDDSWQPRDPPDSPQPQPGDRMRASNPRLAGLTALAAAALLVAGWALASVADVLAEQTGLGSGFVGATLVAISTSLPELSTTIAAVRLRRYAMAVSNIFGGNLTDVGLLFLGDALYREGPLLDATDRSALFTAGAGILVTAVYLFGLVERSDRRIGRIGLDSAFVLLLYAGYVAGSYALR